MGFRIRKTDVFFILIAVSILVYIVIKATISSFTHDESFSYLHYAHTDFIDIIAFKDWYTNNHILNSVLMKYAEKLFGNSELALRLPNILLLLVYMIYCYRLFNKNNIAVAIGVFVILCANNAMVDLFGLARGYGLSIGFMMMSIYHFTKHLETQNRRDILLFHLAMLLAILSSFVLLEVYFSLLIIYNIISFIHFKVIIPQQYSFWQSNKVHLFPILVLAIILYEPVRRVMFNSDLNFGGKTGFYSDTVTSLINYALNATPITTLQADIFKILFTAIVLATTGLIVIKIAKSDIVFWNRNKSLIILNFLLILLSLTIILHRIILGADYPVARFSLFIFPLFILMVGFLLSYLHEYYKTVISIFTIGLATLSCVSFISKLDLNSCSEWEYDMYTKKMMQLIAEDHAKHSPGARNVRIGNNWLFQPTINFYRQTQKMDWLLIADRKGQTRNVDYVYCFEDEIKQLDLSNYTILCRFERIKTVLVRNNLQ
jgi:hypothetical protein